MKFSGKVGNGGDPDHRLDIRIFFRIRHCWEIRKVVNGHKSAAHTDLPYGGTSKTCLGGGMHCPSASSLSFFAKEDMFLSLFVCLLATSRKNFRMDLHEIFRKVWQWASEQMVKFRWRSPHRLDTGIVFRIRH